MCTFAHDDYGGLTAIIKEEKNEALKKLTGYTQRGMLLSYSCWFCINRTFNKKDRLVQHVNKYHSDSHLCASSKQWIILKALWQEHGSAAAAGDFMGDGTRIPVPTHMLKQSADVMRSMLLSSPSFSLMSTTITCIDQVTHWVFTEHGAHIRLRADCVGDRFLRFSQKLYCTQGFLKLVFTLALDSSSKAAAKQIRSLLLRHHINIKAPVPFILPDSHTIIKILKVCTKSYSHVVDRGLTRLADADDFRVVSVDGTFKFLMNVIGQPAHGHSRGDGGSSDDIHVVMTARSLSGCVFFAEALFSENVRRISEKLEAIPRFAVQLELLHVDRPYDWDILFVHKLFVSQLTSRRWGCLALGL